MSATHNTSEMNEIAASLLSTALNSAIATAETSLKQISGLVKDAKLTESALAYFVDQEKKTIEAISQLRAIRIVAAKTPGGAV